MRNKFDLVVLATFRDEVNVKLNNYYYIGISPEGIYRWELPHRYSDNYGVDKKCLIKIHGVDII